MNFVGDTSDWDDFFRHDFVPTILSLVLESWEQMPKLAENAHEDHVTEKLYSALVSGKQRQSHFFLIRIQDVEFDTALEAAIGRKDLAFYPSFEEEIYFCLEAKRLNATVSGASKSLADEYVKNGMQRFVDRKYSPQVRHGGMLGYVLDGDIPRAIANVGNCISLHHAALS
jgi:hypothetical protein